MDCNQASLFILYQSNLAASDTMAAGKVASLPYDCVTAAYHALFPLSSSSASQSLYVSSKPAALILPLCHRSSLEWPTINTFHLYTDILSFLPQTSDLCPLLKCLPSLIFSSIALVLHVFPFSSPLFQTSSQTP